MILCWTDYLKLSSYEPCSVKKWGWGGCLNSFPILEILYLTKFKAFADNKSIVAKIMISLLDRGENIVGKRRKCRVFGFFSFPTKFSFHKTSFSRSLKVRTVWKRANATAKELDSYHSVQFVLADLNQSFLPLANIMYVK